MNEDEINAQAGAGIPLDNEGNILPNGVPDLGASPVQAPEKKPYQRFGGVESALTPIDPIAPVAEAGTQSSSTGVQAFSDPLFLAELREYFARTGRYIEDDEKLIEAFYADQTWSNFNSVSMLKKYGEATTNAASGEMRQLELMQRMKQVYDSTPMFWQEDGRGVEGLGQVVLAAVADPINLIGFGSASAVTKGAIAAGKPTLAAATKGVATGAAAEGVISGVVEAGFDVGQQGIEQQLDPNQEYDAGRTLKAGAIGAAAGTLLGGAFGGVGAKWVTRNGKDMAIRQAELERLGYGEGDIAQLADREVLDILSNATPRAEMAELLAPAAEVVPAAGVPDENGVVNVDIPAPEGPAVAAVPNDSDKLADNLPQIRAQIESVRERVNADLEAAKASGETDRAAQLEADKEFLTTRAAQIDGFIEEQAAAREVINVPDTPENSGGQTPEVKTPTKTETSSEAIANVEAAKLEVSEATEAFARSGDGDDRDAVEAADAKLLAAIKERDGVKPEAPQDAGPQRPDTIKEETWGNLTDEEKVAAVARVDEIFAPAPEAKTTEIGAVSKEERAALFADVEVTDRVKGVEPEATPTLEEFKFTQPNVQQAALDFGLTPEDLAAAKGTAKSGAFNSPDIARLGEKKFPPPQGVTFSGGAVSARFRKLVNEGKIDADKVPAGKYNARKVNALAEEAEASTTIPVRTDEAPLPEYYTSNAQAVSVRKLLADNGRDEDWLKARIDNDAVDNIRLSQKGQLTRKSVQELRAYFAGEGEAAKVRTVKTKKETRAAQKADVAKIADEIAKADEVEDVLSMLADQKGVNRKQFVALIGAGGDVAKAARKLIEEVDPDRGGKVFDALEEDATALNRMVEDTPPKGTLSTIEQKRAKQMTTRLTEMRLAEAGEITDVESAAIQMQAAADVIDYIMKERDQIVPKRSGISPQPISRIAPAGEQSTSGRETLDPTVRKKTVRVAKQKGALIGREQAIAEAERTKSSKPIRFIADKKTKVMDGPTAEVDEELIYNPAPGKAKGVWRSEQNMIDVDQGRAITPRAKATPDVAQDPTIKILANAADEYLNGGDVTDFIQSILGLNVNKAVAQANKLPDLPAVADDGRVLAVRKISSDGEPQPVRVLSEQQAKNGGGVSNLLGKADPAEWEAGYVPAGAKSNSAAAADGFTKATSSGPARLFLSAAEASDEVLPANAGSSWAEFAEDIRELPLREDQRSGYNTPEALYNDLVDKMSEGTATVYDLDRTVRLIDAQTQWARKGTYAGESTLLPGQTSTNAFKMMQKMYAFQQEVAPVPVRLDNVRLDQSQADLAKIGSGFSPAEIVEGQRLLSLIAKDDMAPSITGSEDMNGSAVLSGEIVISPPSPESKFPLPRVYVLMHELGHWAYSNLLTAKDKADFWRVMDETYTDADGIVNEKLLESRLPIPADKLLEAGVTSGGNMRDDPAELFANNFMTWLARNHLDKGLKTRPEFTKFAAAGPFWGRIKSYVSAIINRFFNDKEAIDPDLAAVFSKIVPDYNEARALEAGDLKAKTDGGRAILRRVSMIRTLHYELNTALEADSPEGIVQGAVELARELYGLAGTGSRKDTPAFQMLEKAFPNARAIYGKVFEALRVSDAEEYLNKNTGSFDFDYNVTNYEAVARELREVFETSDNGETFFLDGNIEAILGKAKAKFNSLTGEDFVSLDRNFNLRKRSESGQARGYKKLRAAYGRNAKRAKGTQRARLEKRGNSARDLASATRLETPIEDVSGTEYADLNIGRQTTERLGELLTETKDTAFGKRVADELVARTNTQPVTDVPQTQVSSPIVSAAINREIQHTAGWAEETVSPKARASMNEVQRKLNHRDKARQTVMRSMYYRIANLADAADPSSSRPLEGILELEAARKALRPVSTNLVGSSTGSVASPETPIRRIAEVLTELQVHQGDAPTTTADEDIISLAVKHLKASDDSELIDLPLSDYEAVVRLSDAIGYVTNGHASKAVRTHLPNLDAYRSVFRDDNVYKEMREFDAVMSRKKITSEGATPGEQLDAMDRAQANAGAAWEQSPTSRRRDILTWLGRDVDEVGLDSAPKTYHVAGGTKGVGTGKMSTLDPVYGNGAQVFDDPYSAGSTSNEVNLSTLTNDALAEVGIEGDEARKLMELVDLRKRQLNRAATLRNEARNSAEVGEINKAASELATARDFEEMAAAMTDDILNGFRVPKGRDATYVGPVRGIKNLNINTSVTSPVYMKLKKVADFSDRSLYDLGAGEEQWNDLVWPILRRAGSRYRGDTDTRLFSNFLKRMGSLTDADGQPRKQIDGREIFNELALLIGDGRQERGAATLKMVLRDLGYDGLIGSRAPDQYGRSSRAPRFVMPLSPRDQLKSIHAKEFMPSGQNQPAMKQMVEEARFAAPAIAKTIAATGPLSKEDVGRFVDIMQRMGAEPEAATTMAKMAEGQYPTAKEAGTFQRFWTHAIGQNTDALRMNNLNWFADWVKPKAGTGHFERLSSQTGLALQPIQKALSDLGDHSNKVIGALSNWKRKSSDFQLGKVSPESRSRQPESHKKIVKALRRDPGSPEELALTETELVAYKELRKFFTQMRGRLDETGVMSGKIDTYFPQVWSVEKIEQNFDEFAANLGKYFVDESRANEGVAMPMGIAIQKAKRVASRLIDDEGLYVPPPGGGARAPNGDHIDFQRLIRLDRFQDHLEGVGSFLEDNLEGIVSKYADTTLRRIDFAEKFGEQSHAFYDYMAVMNEPTDMASAIANLLTTNKVAKQSFKTPGINEDGGLDEAVIERLTIMPFAPNEQRGIDEQLSRAFGAGEKAIKLFQENGAGGADAARSYLMDLFPRNAPQTARQTYSKRVDAIVGGIADRTAAGGEAVAAPRVQHATEVMRRIQRKGPGNGGWNSKGANTASKVFRNFNSLTMLSYTTLTSLGDLVLPLMRSGNMKNWATAMNKFASQPEYRQMIKQSGVAIENVIHERMTNLYGNSIGKNTVAFFNATGLTPWTTMNRELAGAVGFEWFKSEYDIALKAFDAAKPLPAQNPRFKKAYRVLRQYGLEGYLADNVRIDNITDMADFPQLREALVKFSNEAIFTPNPNDIPLWAQSPVGQLVFQLKSFPLMMARYAKDVWKNAATVDPVTKGGRRFSPALMFLTVGPAAGAMSLSAKDIVQFRGEDEKPELRERLVSEALDKMGVEFKTTAEADAFMGWYYEGFMMMGGLGLMGELLHDSVQQADQGGAYGAMRFFGNVGGPSVGTAWNAFDVASGGLNAITDGADDGTGKERAAVRAVAGRIPILGGNRAFKEGATDAIAGEPTKPGRKKATGWGGGFDSGGWES